MSAEVSGANPRSHPEIMRHQEGFSFVPGNRSLSAVEVSLVNVMGWETVLRQYVDGVKCSYNYILLDCRPSLGMLVINALSASDCVLPPCPGGLPCGGGHDRVGGNCPEHPAANQPQAENRWRIPDQANETNFRKDVISAVRENCGKHLPVLDTVIPATVRLAEASTAWEGWGLCLTAPTVYEYFLGGGPAGRFGVLPIKQPCGSSTDLTRMGRYRSFTTTPETMMWL